MLCWISGSLAKQKISDHFLQEEDRTRQANMRVRIERSATGWEVFRSATKVADLFLPAEGVPRLSLLFGQDPGATVQLLAEGRTAKDPSAVEQPLRLVRRENEPTVRNGPVFGTLRATYDYRDQTGPVLWTETFRLRFFDGPAELLLVDLDVQWRATAGGIWFGGGDTELSGLLPVLRTEIFSSDRGQFVASPGRIGAEEIEGTASPMMLWVGNDGSIEGTAENQPEPSLGLFVHSGNIGSPPIWRHTSKTSFRSIPNLGIQSHGRRGIRLAMGEHIDLRYRLILYRAKDPISFGTDRYLDFDCPPQVECV